MIALLCRDVITLSYRDMLAVESWRRALQVSLVMDVATLAFVCDFWVARDARVFCLASGLLLAFGNSRDGISLHVALIPVVACRALLGAHRAFLVADLARGVPCVPGLFLVKRWGSLVMASSGIVEP